MRRTSISFSIDGHISRSRSRSRRYLGGQDKYSEDVSYDSYAANYRLGILMRVRSRNIDIESEEELVSGARQESVITLPYQQDTLQPEGTGVSSHHDGGVRVGRATVQRTQVTEEEMILEEIFKAY